jgi:hypothetical protein
MVYSVYELDTGEFTGARLSGDPDFVQRNTPAGMAVLSGEHDHQRWRVDLRSGDLIPFQPSMPADNALVTWHWDEQAWRWTPIPTRASKLTIVREQRNALLAASDWAALPDVPMSVERREAWATYRQALRDITEQADPFNIVWPQAPER